MAGTPGIDVSNLAVHYGGGRYPAAAGAEINGAMEVFIPLVLQATEQLSIQKSCQFTP
jgi:nanoRNase/pAp phosphatase (c-di-AMP/oligoRNAs hydrolase)